MPVLSLVVTAHDVAPYIERCLRSLLAVPCDVDVVVVDDGSTDGTTDLIAAIAADDPRVRVLRNDVATGPGPARNRGLATSAGTYVWFVDGDDWLLDGALPAVVAALETEPDVLVVDFVRSYPSGRTASSSSQPVLARAPGTAFRLTDFPALVQVLHVPWNKVVRRALLDTANPAFPAAPVYEDLQFTYRSLRGARAIQVLRTPVYAYRTARPGALTRRRGAQHLAWAEEWHAVLDGATHEADAVRDALFRRMVWHGWAVMGVENGWRVPLRQRRRFFHRFAALHECHRRPQGPQDRVVRRGWWPLGEVRVALDAGRWVLARAGARVRRHRSDPATAW